MIKYSKIATQTVNSTFNLQTKNASNHTNKVRKRKEYITMKASIVPLLVLLQLPSYFLEKFNTT